jgi:hypothetical protein
LTLTQNLFGRPLKPKMITRRMAGVLGAAVELEPTQATISLKTHRCSYVTSVTCRGLMRTSLRASVVSRDPALSVVLANIENVAK